MSIILGKTEYVVGFLFSPDNKRVVLLKKRPTAGWQANMLNGVGGRIEVGESRDNAMIREFLEETGVGIQNWEWYARLTGNKYVVHVYRAFDNSIDKCETTTDEDVAWYWVSGVSDLYVVPNLRYLVPLALSTVGGLVLPVDFTFNNDLD